MTQSTVRLSKEELRDLTGYEQPSKQLAELHRRGFHRASFARLHC